MSRRIQAPRGTYDVLPEQATARAALEARAREVLEAAGYERVETPIFEHTELFARGVGESTDIVQKEMYTFEDAGGRSLTLRPEGTAAICRAYVEHGMHKLAQPVKLWYLGPFFRYERAQAGRFRQFWQIGSEAIGSEDPAVDAESILLLTALLADLGARGVHVKVSSLGKLASRRQYRAALQDHLRAHEDRLSQDVRERIDLNPLRAFDADHPGTREVMRTAPLLRDFLDAEDAEHFADVLSLLDAGDVTYEVDPTLVRGLDYYQRTVFEIHSSELGAQSALGGGGRYDGLVEDLGGPPTPAIGWAAGVERILMAAATPPHAAPPVDLLVAAPVGPRQFGLVADARRAGLQAQVDLGGRSHKGLLKHANRLGARYVAWVSDDSEQAELRDMEAGEQREVALDEVIRDVLRGPGL